MDPYIDIVEKLVGEKLERFVPIRKRLLYVVNHSVTYIENGYALRTHMIATGLVKLGYEVLCLIKPGRPWDFSYCERSVEFSETIDGVSYYHMPKDYRSQSREYELLDDYSIINEFVKVYRPALIIGATNYRVSAPAYICSRQYGLGFVNEVRGFWELSAAAIPGQAKSYSDVDVARDRYLSNKSDLVLTINERMKSKIVNSGVDENRVLVVKNTSVDVGGQTKVAKYDALVEGINEATTVFCYAGNFNAYERVDEICKAVVDVKRLGGNVHLLLIGEGEFSPLADWPGISFIGQVKNSDLVRIYSIVDVFVLNRSKSTVAEIVQPYKYCEAERFCSTVIAPDYMSGVFDGYDCKIEYFQDGQLKEKIIECSRISHNLNIKCNSKEFFDISNYLVEFSRELNGLIGELDAVPETSYSKVLEMLTEEVFGYSSVETIVREIDDLLVAGQLQDALVLAKKILSIDKHNISGNVLDVCIKTLFYNMRYKEIEELISDASNISASAKKICALSSAYEKLKFEFSNVVENGVSYPGFIPTKGKSLYFLHSSLPYFSGGYATRAHGLAVALRKTGTDICVYTRPNFPYDVRRELKDCDLDLKKVVDGVVYTRTTCKSVRLRNEAEYMLDCIKVFDDAIVKERPDYIHGRSTYQISLPALIAARIHKLPFVYEVSGLWEIVHESRSNSNERRWETEKIRYFETLVAKSADAVYTLTNAMRLELISRGVDGKKIHILPNCTNPDVFTPKTKDPEILNALGIEANVPVIGYIGSFQDYEGLDDLILACELMSERDIYNDFRLLLVGDGPYFEVIKEIVMSSKISHRVIMPGRVPHEKAVEFYTIVDICPFPRKSWPVCEMVSPMKPLEALSMEKAVVVSDVLALSEMIVEGETGFSFKKGNIEDLSAVLEKLTKSKSTRESVGAAARSWVQSHRTWSNVVESFFQSGKVKKI